VEPKTRQEIDVQNSSGTGGSENYGWRIREGFVQSPGLTTLSHPMRLVRFSIMSSVICGAGSRSRLKEILPLEAGPRGIAIRPMGARPTRPM
jgi:hypothetical protein